MSEALDLLASYVFNAAWQICAIAIAAWLINRVFGRRNPKLQHRIWVSSLILSAAVPIVGLLFAHISDWRSTALAIGFVPKAFIARSNSGSHSAAGVLIRAILVRAIGGAYVAFVLFKIITFLYRLYGIRKLKRSAVPLSLPVEKQGA